MGFFANLRIALRILWPVIYASPTQFLRFVLLPIIVSSFISILLASIFVVSLLVVILRNQGSWTAYFCGFIHSPNGWLSKLLAYFLAGWYTQYCPTSSHKPHWQRKKFWLGISS